jgi:hypothetical protein
MDDEFDLWIDGQHFGHFGNRAEDESYYMRKSVHHVGKYLAPGEHLLVFRVNDWAGGGGIHREPLALANDSTLFMTRTERLYALARRDPHLLWPYWVQGKGQSWTVIGLADAVAEGLVSHDGMIGANTWPFTLSLWLRIQDGTVYAAESLSPVRLNWQLKEGFLPLPQMMFGDENIRIRQSHACLPEVNGGAGITRVDYEVASAFTSPVTARLFLAVRPYLVNSKVSELRQITWQEEKQRVLIENKFPLWCSPGAPDSVYLQPVSILRLDQSPGDISRIVLENSAENNSSSPGIEPGGPGEDSLRMASALFAWDIVLNPGVNIFQFHAPLQGGEGWKDAGEFALSPDTQQLAHGWRDQLTKVELKLPDEPLRNAYYASLAYILINADRGMPHPGPLAYDLFWYRDTAYILAALLRNGQFELARQVVAHLMAAQRPNGEFPPIFDLNYKRIGTREWDSQGQALFSLAEYVFFSGDTGIVRSCWPQLERGVAFLDSLQNGSKSGILPPSWSAEDLGSGNWHHYWDDFWAVTGLYHVALLAEKMGWPEKALRLREKAERLSEATRASYLEVLEKKKISWIPNGPEDLRGSSMARGTSPGLWPGGALAANDPLVKQSFQYYWKTWIEPYRGAYLHHNGFWPYAFELGYCYLRLDQPERAHTILNWHLAHQTFPGLYAWAEVLDTVNYRFQAGDMPHAWVAADYINLLRGLLVDERGDTLVLGAGIPREWLITGEAVGISGAFTRFGKMSFAVNYEESSQSLQWSIAGEELTAAGLKLKLPRELCCKSVMVDGIPWQDFNAAEVRLPVSAKHVLARLGR